MGYIACELKGLHVGLTCYPKSDPSQWRAVVRSSRYMMGMDELELSTRRPLLPHSANQTPGVDRGCVKRLFARHAGWLTGEFDVKSRLKLHLRG